MSHLADAIRSSGLGFPSVTYLVLWLGVVQWLDGYGSVVESSSLHLATGLVLAAQRLFRQN